MIKILHILLTPLLCATAILSGHAQKPGFAKGADVGWITEMEADGCKFYNQEGVEKECMTLLRDDCGVNSIRLRVW
ncbi:MAG: glycosyl hydrolase 53 family protein, partial [Muribaculaceae bacterium]|nr:glycosyl hydrolase 53 family protein [Muribaculaceae bacterium]